MTRPRYFVGYPTRGLRPARLLLAVLWVILALHSTAKFVAAELRPIRKLAHDPVPHPVPLSHVSQPPVSPTEYCRRGGPGYCCALQETPAAGHPPVLVISAARLEATRIAGNPRIPPPAGVRKLMRQTNRTKLVAVVRMCLRPSGRVDTLRILKPSGYPAYDRRLLSRMRQWRYRPWLVDGKAVPLCTFMAFIESSEPPAVGR